MYLHIGEDLSIRLKDIIAILDQQSGDSSLLVQEFLRRNEEKLINVAKKSYKSIVITNEHVYLSPFASVTLKRRSNLMNIQE